MKTNALHDQALLEQLSDVGGRIAGHMNLESNYYGYEILRRAETLLTSGSPSGSSESLLVPSSVIVEMMK